MKRASQISKRIAVVSAAFCICSLVAWDSPASRHDNNSITRLTYAQDHARTTVEIGVKSDPTFSVYTLESPDRVVVEVLDCDSTQGVAPIQVRNGVIETAAVSLSQSSEYNACRVILSLDKDAPYTVDSTKDRIMVAVEGTPTLQTGSGVQEREEALAKAQAAMAQDTSVQTPEITMQASLDSAEVSQLQKKLKTLEAQKAQLEEDVQASGSARRQLKKLKAEASPDQEKIAELEAITHQGRKSREELIACKAEIASIQEQLAGGQATSKDQRIAQNVSTTVPKSAPIDEQAAKVAPVQEQVAKVAPIDDQAAATASVRDIQFKHDDDGNGMQVVVQLSAPAAKVENIDMGSNQSILKIADAVLPENFNKKFDTSAFNQGIRFVDSTQKPGAIELVAQTSLRTVNSVEQKDNTITWHLSPVRSEYAASVDRRDQAMVSAAEPSTYALSNSFGSKGTLKDSPLAKRKITLDIHDADINDLLRLLSDEINTSIVVSPDVKGNVTLSLKSVPLDQALDIILRMHNLGMRYEGNIIWIAKAETFRAEEERALQAAEVRERLEPLEVRLIPVNYASADDLKENVQNMLSSRGTLNIDKRTNTLILKDVTANLDAAELLVSSLDTQTPQILIEARIVETQANFTKEMGIQWGGDGIASAQTGNATGIVFPSTIGIAGGSTSDNNSGTSATPNFAVNLPASVGTGAGGALGITLGSIGGAINLNIRLSALENKGFLKIVSAPRIMTLDNIQASIEQGTSIPISVVSAAGAQTVFYDAKLNLQVTPHVTRDGNVYLKIDITKNEPDFGNTGASGDPSIIQKEAHTELLIPDGETTVIGGIYTRNTSQSMASVPFFGSIPILGYLFKSTSETDNRTELLIFITPRIINRDASIAAPGQGSFIPPVERKSDSSK